MLEISAQNFERFNAAEADRFFARLSDFIREFAPGTRSESPQAMQQTVRGLSTEAHCHGLTSEIAIATYVLTAAHLGADFSTRFPAAREILEMDAAEERKVDLLRGLTLSLLTALER